MDMNRQSLHTAARRIQRYRPTCFERDVFESFGEPPSRVFDSIGLTYLLHCLPGSIRDKSRVFQNAMPWLAPDGCVFGATIMAQDVPHGLPARALMAFYNQRGIFSNIHDDPSSLDAALRQYFRQVEIRRIGCVVLFNAQVPIL